MEELVATIVVSAVGYAARKTARWGIGALKAKGVAVPAWVERLGPEMVGTVAGFGTAIEAREIVGRSSGA